MPRQTLRRKQCKQARSKREIEQPDYIPISKRQRPSSEPLESDPEVSQSAQLGGNILGEHIISDEHWLDLQMGWGEDDSGSEVEVSDTEEEMDSSGELGGSRKQFKNAFKVLLKATKKQVWSEIKFPYQRGAIESRQTRWNREKKARELADEGASIPKLDTFLFTSSTTSTQKTPQPQTLSTESTAETETRSPTKMELEEAIDKMEKKLKGRRNGIQGQNLMRHRAVLIFLNFQLSLPTSEHTDTRLRYAILAAKSFRRGIYLARKIISWEIQWRAGGQIEESRRGCHVKTRSWFNDEGVQLAAREFVREGGKKITAFDLAKAIGEYLNSERAKGIMTEVLENAFSSSIETRTSHRVTARTARAWLAKMGFRHCRIGKGVYYDGHERSDVIKYREDEFLPSWLAFRKRMIQFSEDGTWRLPDGAYQGTDKRWYCSDGSRPIVLVTHDESTFNANDSKRSGWFKVGSDGNPQFPIEPKSRGKGIMVSMFVTPGGILRVPDSTADEELLRKYPDWPRKSDGSLLREAIQQLEYGKENYWTGDKMVDQTIKEALPIFREAFPDFEALFAFDNASNHSAYASDALVASRMNLEPGGKVPEMHETWWCKPEDGVKITQSMVFPMNHYDFQLRGKVKGIKQVLRERKLWPSTGLDGKARNSLGFAFLLTCPTSNGREGCPKDPDDPDLGCLVGKCCARALMAAQPDFLEERSRLETELKARSQSFVFYPKFHCELNFIERVWSAAKHYAREHCEYDLEGLRRVVPEAISSVPVHSFVRYYQHCERLIDAYADPQKYEYGTRAFKDRVYLNHRQVVDKSKW